MSSREADFPESIKRTVAQRVGYRCSKYGCGITTAGPHTDVSKANIVGVAAHIEGAQEGSARYNSSLTLEQKKASDNAIWMCASCGDLIDNDEAAYPVALLRFWKQLAEEAAHKNLGKATPVKYRKDLIDRAYDDALVSARMPVTTHGGFNNAIVSTLSRYIDLTNDEKIDIYLLSTPSKKC